MYHYRGAGLGNVYLKNGYREIKFGDEIAVSVENVQGLHLAIAATLIHKPAGLTGQEFRFLRIEMDLAQHRLGRLLGVGEQSIRQWENNVTRQIPGSAERLMRAFARERLLNQDGEVTGMLEELAELDHFVMEQMLFEETQNVWSEAA